MDNQAKRQLINVKSPPPSREITPPFSREITPPLNL